MAKKLLQKSNNRQELFDNTINHFNSENRCVDKAACKYRLNEKGCAIGREISDKLANELDESNCGDTSVSECEIFNKLPKRLQRMGRNFLTDIQRFHDNATDWDENGLSQSGKKNAKEIAKKFNLNFSE